MLLGTTTQNRSMKAKRLFPDEVLAILRQAKGLGIRAGKSQHRFVGIWVVMVEDRVRSWSVEPNGWYRMLLSSVVVARDLACPRSLAYFRAPGVLYFSR